MDDDAGSLTLSELEDMRVIDAAGREVGALLDVVALAAPEAPAVTGFFIDHDDDQLARHLGAGRRAGHGRGRTAPGLRRRRAGARLAARRRAGPGRLRAGQPGAGHAPPPLRARPGRGAHAARRRPRGGGRGRRSRRPGAALRPVLPVAPPAAPQRRLRALGRRQPHRPAPLPPELRGGLRRAQRAAPGRHRRRHLARWGRASAPPCWPR